MAADLAIVRTQGRYALITALRTPRTLIFSIIFPLILLVMFNSIFSKGANETHHFAGHTITAASYFTAGLAAYSITLTTFTALVVAITTQRESGQLKRLRGTPMPAWTFMVAQIARSLVLATAMTVALFALGVIAFHVHLRAASVVGIAVYLVLGVATMTALGIALTAFTPWLVLSSTLAEAQTMPSQLIHMIGVGESGGRLVEVLGVVVVEARNRFEERMALVSTVSYWHSSREMVASSNSSVL